MIWLDCPVCGAPFQTCCGTEYMPLPPVDFPPPALPTKGKAMASQQPNETDAQRRLREDREAEQQRQAEEQRRQAEAQQQTTRGQGQENQ